jgi:hypothetical protein
MDKHLTDSESSNDRNYITAFVTVSGCTHDLTMNTYQQIHQSKTKLLGDTFIHRMAQYISQKTGESVKSIKQRWNWIRHYENKSGNAHLHCNVTLTDSDVEYIDGHGRHLWGDITEHTAKKGKRTRVNKRKDDKPNLSNSAAPMTLDKEQKTGTVWRNALDNSVDIKSIRQCLKSKRPVGVIKPQYKKKKKRGKLFLRPYVEHARKGRFAMAWYNTKENTLV